MGYLVSVSIPTIATVSVGSEARFYIYDNVREDARDAYGFSTYDELAVFQKTHKHFRRRSQGCAHYPLRGISSRDSGCDSFRQPLISHVRSRRRHEDGAEDRVGVERKNRGRV